MPTNATMREVVHEFVSGPQRHFRCRICGAHPYTTAHSAAARGLTVEQERAREDAVVARLARESKAQPMDINDMLLGTADTTDDEAEPQLAPLLAGVAGGIGGHVGAHVADGLHPHDDDKTAEPQVEPVPAVAPAPADEAPGAGNRFDLLAATLQGGHGIVTDPVAQTCFDVELGDGRKATISPGVLGWLDEQQQQDLCVRREALALNDEGREHLRTYLDITQVCTTDPDASGAAIVSCVSRELERRNIR